MLTLKQRWRTVTPCQCTRNSPAKAPLHSCEWPTEPWHRIHVDYADYDGQYPLVVADAHSKWINAYTTRTMTSTNTIERLRSCFATHGLPHVLVSDNGPCFASSEFAEFAQRNGIRHKLVSPYHQASNGLAECSVGLVKMEYGRCLEERWKRNCPVFCLRTA